MKTVIFTLLVLITGVTLSYGQCGKKSMITTSKTDHLDKDGTITRTETEKAVVELNDKGLTITINDDHKMTGIIKSNACDWKVPYKEGKSTIKAILNDGSGEDKNVTITIEGKDGKVTPAV